VLGKAHYAGKTVLRERGRFWTQLPLKIHTFLDMGHLHNASVADRDKCLRHHGMARPQIADGGTASNMKGSGEYIE
jgi:hypothetical protein